jgi:predicted O-linked N-acetylglucosamine transferase (SPINDLY family)
MIAHDTGGYVAAAVALAADGEKRAALRRDLRDRVAASRLCDPVAYARSVERAYLELWQNKARVAGALR